MAKYKPNQKPRFFCDNCGEEVGEDVRSCPFCGRFFAAVRCPACGFSGEDRLFSNGCPACGYSAADIVKKKKPHKKKKTHTPDEPLPVGVYIFSFLALIAVIAILSHIMTR